MIRLAEFKLVIVHSTTIAKGITIYVREMDDFLRRVGLKIPAVLVTVIEFLCWLIDWLIDFFLVKVGVGVDYL